LQHITPRLTADDIVERAQRAEEARVLESLRGHMVSEWEALDRKRAKLDALLVIVIAVAVGLSVILILAWR
jgi:preprotein translocase subunit Sec61beta